MYYILFYETIDDYLTRRAPFRKLHFEHLQNALDAGELVMAGAYANPADGAALIFKGDNAEAAARFAKTDPYVLNDLIKKWYVREWTVVFGGE